MNPKTPILNRYSYVQKPKPIGGLLDKRFVYVPAASTNIRATFERVRAEQQQGVRL